MFTSALAPGP